MIAAGRYVGPRNDFVVPQGGTTKSIDGEMQAKGYAGFFPLEELAVILRAGCKLQEIINTPPIFWHSPFLDSDWLCCIKIFENKIIPRDAAY